MSEVGGTHQLLNRICYTYDMIKFAVALSNIWIWNDTSVNKY